jgi:hypothetical protein
MATPPWSVQYAEDLGTISRLWHDLERIDPDNALLLYFDPKRYVLTNHQALIREVWSEKAYLKTTGCTIFLLAKYMIRLRAEIEYFKQERSQSHLTRIKPQRV